MTTPQFETILGSDVDVLTPSGLLESIQRDLQQRRQVRIVAINPEKIITCRKDSAFQALLNGFEYKIPDGIGIIWASKLHQGSIKERITGIDTMLALCELAQKQQVRVFLYGSKAEVLALAKTQLETRYPGILIVGTLDGYQNDQEKVLSTLNEAAPDLLFVALGSPKQEHWISDNRTRLNACVLMGVGGSYDVISQQKERAPAGFRKLGLEWFYRLLKEPSRLFRQTKLVTFAWMALTRWGKRYRA